MEKYAIILSASTALGLIDLIIILLYLILVTILIRTFYLVGRIAIKLLWVIFIAALLVMLQFIMLQSIM